MKTTKTTCTRETQKAYTARTGKGKQKRLQAKGGQRGTSDSAERVWGVRPKDNISPCPIGHLPFQGRQKTPLPCQLSQNKAHSTNIFKKVPLEKGDVSVS